MTSTTSTQAVTVSYVVSLIGSGVDAEAYNAAYRSLTVGDRAKVRTECERRMAEAVGNLDLNAATLWKVGRESLDGSTAKVAPEVDHQALAYRALANLQRAIEAVEAYAEANEVTFEAFDPSAIEADEALIEALTTKSGLKVGTTRTYVGPKRDVTRHLAEVAARMESGAHLTCSQVGHEVTAEYPNGDLSGGAVWARLSSDTFDAAAMGLEVVDTKGSRGIRKI